MTFKSGVLHLKLERNSSLRIEGKDEKQTEVKVHLILILRIEVLKSEGSDPESFLYGILLIIYYCVISRHHLL